MKRMTVIAGYQDVQNGMNETQHIVVVKGAPEVLRDMVSCYFENFYSKFSTKQYLLITIQPIKNWLKPEHVF